jgi:hypothetical protein
VAVGEIYAAEPTGFGRRHGERAFVETDCDLSERIYRGWSGVGTTIADTAGYVEQSAYEARNRNALAAGCRPAVAVPLTKGHCAIDAVALGGELRKLELRERCGHLLSRQSAGPKELVRSSRQALQQ